MKATEFYTICLVIGSLLIAVGSLSYLSVNSFSPYYNSYNSTYRGFTILSNSSSVITPKSMNLRIDVTGEPTLDFDYTYEVKGNGTYNFIFIFPFEITECRDQNNDMNYNVTDGGTIVWTSHSLSNVAPSGTEDLIRGHFYISNTFQSGSKGEYVFSLPLNHEYSSNELKNQIKNELGLGFDLSVIELRISLSVPTSFEVTQFYPQPAVRRNFPTEKQIVWDIEGLHLLQQEFVVFCKDTTEVSSSQFLLLICGISISLGGSLVVRVIYDLSKPQKKEAILENTE